MKRVNLVTIKMEKLKSMLFETNIFSTPKDVYNISKQFLEGADREHLISLQLDTKNKISSITTISVGSLNQSVVHPREVFKAAILSNSASIILVHNHPSGDVTPSNEDINSSLRIKESGKILGIELLDHLVMGNDSFTSLKEKGIL